MKTFVIVLAALCGMAFAQYDDHSVRVAEQPGGASNLVQNPDQAFYRPHGGNGGSEINIVPDQAFYQPHNNNGGGVNGQVPPSASPTFVDNANARPPYPYKKYDNPYARGGK